MWILVIMNTTHYKAPHEFYIHKNTFIPGLVRYTQKWYKGDIKRKGCLKGLTRFYAVVDSTLKMIQKTNDKKLMRKVWNFEKENNLNN